MMGIGVRIILLMQDKSNPLLRDWSSTFQGLGQTTFNMHAAFIYLYVSELTVFPFSSSLPVSHPF